MSEFHSLANLIKRLEVATGRLEDLAMSASSASAVAASTTATAAATATTSSSSQAVSSSEPLREAALPLTVQRYDEYIVPLVEKFVEISREIGEPVASQAALVAETVQAERAFVYTACKAQKPDMSSLVFAKLIEPIQTPLTSVVKMQDQNRGDPLFSHLSVVSEGIQALAWFTYEPTPVPFIRDMKDASQFYINRILREYKDKDPKHVQWTQSFSAILDALARYVKENYPTGLTWNSQGEPAEHLISQQQQQQDGIPPPPPPPPPMTFDEEQQKPSGAAAVFAEINKGESVTAGLRKVDKTAPPAPRRTEMPKKQGPPTPNKPDKYVLKKPAKTTLESNKWVVENHENNPEIVIEDTAINQAVYIFGCKNSTIRIKGKVNAVTMDSCVKCGVALDSTVSTVDLVNCRSFGLQIFNVTPTIAVDKCDGGQIYLSKECLDVEILSAKSSSINVLIPEELEGGETDFKELAVPEQFKTTVVDGKLQTVMVEHAG